MLHVVTLLDSERKFGSSGFKYWQVKIRILLLKIQAFFLKIDWNHTIRNIELADEAPPKISIEQILHNFL